MPITDALLPRFNKKQYSYQYSNLKLNFFHIEKAWYPGPTCSLRIDEYG